MATNPSLKPDLAASHRILGRLAYGARPQEAEALSREGTAAWIDRQFRLPKEEPELQRRIDEMTAPLFYAAGAGEQVTEGVRGFTSLAAVQADRAALVQEGMRRVPSQEADRPRLELSLATLVRRASAEAQLRERLVEFWHDHFSVSCLVGSWVSVSLPDHDQRLRQHALGDFRVLLEAVASGAAMLVYLNNQSSRAGAPNENFARELLELHTLGRAAYFGSTRNWRLVPRDANGLATGYADADVWEVARAFTGWSVATGQQVDAGTRLPRIGEFAYVEAWHDPYQKRILGQEFEPFGPPLADGRKVLDLLAAHPATARFISRKLARFLIGDPVPEAAVARATAAFLAHAGRPDQIEQVVRALLAGGEVASGAYQRIRRPSDLVLATVRALGIPFSPVPLLLQMLAQAGQFMFGWLAPDGPPLDAAYYLASGSMRVRWHLVHVLTHDRWKTGTSPMLQELAGTEAHAAAARLAALALGAGAEATGRTVAEAWIAGNRPARLNAASVAELAGWVLASPAFQAT